MSPRCTFALGVFLLAWLGANLLTLDRYPVAWMDEVCYADPAINLVQSGHWVSYCWPAQDATEFWAGNTPLYPMLLSGWLRLTGISMTSVRSLNLVLMLGVVSMLHRAVRQLIQQRSATAHESHVPLGNSSGSGEESLVRESGSGFMVVLLALFGYSMIFDYRSGRPDCVGMILFSAGFLAVVCCTGIRRHLLVSLCAFLMPWAGLQCLPVLAVLMGFLLWLNWRAYFFEVLCAGVFSVVGFSALAWLYAAHHVWPAFMASVAPHTVAGSLQSVLQGQFSHHNKIPKDFSFIVLFIAALCAELVSWKRRGVRVKSPISLGLLISIVSGAALMAAGKFPTYYGWLTYLPLSVAVVFELSNRSIARATRRLLNYGCILAVLAGLAPHLCAAVYDWSFRSPSIPDQLVAKNIREGDFAYGNPSVYYALRRHDLAPNVGYRIHSFRPEERKRLTVLFLNPAEVSYVTENLGGTWRKVDEFKPGRSGFLGTPYNLGFLSLYNYQLEVYRR